MAEQNTTEALLTSLMALLGRIVESQERICNRLESLDSSWRDGDYSPGCIDPDDFRRLQLDVETIERRTRGMGNG